jgi:hypothetical protein
LKKIYKGTIEGNVIHLDENAGFSVGTHALVTLKTLSEATQADIQNRQLRLLDKGFSLGKKLYANREDLYARYVDHLLRKEY